MCLITYIPNEIIQVLADNIKLALKKCHNCDINIQVCVCLPSLCNRWNSNYSKPETGHFNEINERFKSMRFSQPLWHWFQILIKSHMVREKWSEPNGWTRLYSPGYGRWLHLCLNSHWEAGTHVSFLSEIPPADLKKQKKYCMSTSVFIILWAFLLFYIKINCSI